MKKKPLPKGKIVSYVFEFTYPEQVHRLGIWKLKIWKSGKRIAVIATKRRKKVRHA